MTDPTEQHDDTQTATREPTGFEVKPLEWIATGKSAGEIRAQNYIGIWVIYENALDEWTLDNGEHFSSHVDITGAKAAAKIDCETRIRSAITPTQTDTRQPTGFEVKPLDWERLSDHHYRVELPLFGNLRVQTDGYYWITPTQTETREAELIEALRAIHRQMDYPQHYNVAIDTICNKALMGDTK